MGKNMVNLNSKNAPGCFLLITGTGHCGTQWISRVLHRPNDGMVCYHGEKLKWVPKHWKECLQHEFEKGIDGLFDDYFSFISQELKRYPVVGDSNSWTFLKIPEVSRRQQVNKIIYLVRNSVQTVHSAYYQHQREGFHRNDFVYSVFLRQYWEMLGRPWFDWDKFTQWACHCFVWSLNQHMPNWLSNHLNNTEILVYRFEELLNDVSSLEKLIKILNPLSKPIQEELRKWQETDVNRKVQGERSPSAFWDKWSEEQRTVFREICGSTMEIYNYEIPEKRQNGKLRKEIYGSASVTLNTKSGAEPKRQETLPIAIFELHTVCNQGCSYCVAGASPQNDFGPIVNPNYVNKIKKFFSEHGPFNILFTGGEPLITPNISDLFRFLVNEGHSVSLQSNLKYGADLFYDVVPPDRTGWILTTLHSIQLKNFERYFQTILMLKRKGYPIVIKLLLDDVMLKEFMPIYSKLEENSIGIILSPLIYFPSDNEPFPKQYTPEQWKLIAPRITLCSSWLYFAGGYRSQGTQCYAGSRVFYIRAQSGSISGCAHSYPSSLGNLYSNIFSPMKKPVKCGLNLCICDFNYYSGIIPDLDESERFNSLLWGKTEPVSFDSYLRFIGKIGIEPIIDLKPLVSDKSPEDTSKALSFNAPNSYSPAELENLKGECFFNQGDIDEALQSFKKAVEIDPDLASAHNNLGVCYWQKEEFEKAIEHFLKALELDPDNADALANYIKILIGLGDVEEAKKLYFNYLKRNPEGDEETVAAIANFNPPPSVTIEHKEMGAVNVPVVSVKDLHKKLGFARPIDYPVGSLIKPLAEWKMEIDDAPIFRYIYRHFRPRRHLEFGTWQGTGTVYCLEECDATVWTINPPFGEDRPDGDAAYGHDEAELPFVRAWAKKVGLLEKDSYKTDTIGFIGRFYLEKEIGHRVCQIYCDSRKWETSNYPTDFFDTVLIDGGHAKDVVINDTLKAFKLLRPGGIIMWHDFCPPVWDRYETTIGVTEAVLEMWDWIQENTSQIFWIYPSYILLGVKA
jgi:MoaA/NifB/PqqE/SkfB family radical SAM enzyme